MLFMGTKTKDLQMNEQNYRISGRKVDCFRCSFSDKFVDQSDVGKGSTSHNGVVSTSGSVGVEFSRSQSAMRSKSQFSSFISQDAGSKKLEKFPMCEYFHSRNQNTLKLCSILLRINHAVSKTVLELKAVIAVTKLGEEYNNRNLLRNKIRAREGTIELECTILLYGSDITSLDFQ